MIFLHGGPGFPIPFCEGCRGMFPEITERFIVVFWDQLGCGINNCKIDDSYSVGNFADMTVELIQVIRKEFPENTISLFGVSWGSVLAAKAAQRVPELLYRVMIYGQVLKQLTFNEEVFKTLENSNMPAKQRQQLEIIKNEDKHTLQELKSVMGWVQKYTEGYQSKAGGKAPLGKIIYGVLTSPDYSLKDLKAVVINGYRENKSLLTELMDIDLSEVLRKIQIPYLILQGDFDIVTSTKMISAFTESVRNENIVFHRIQNSGHMPGSAAMDYITKNGFNFLDSRIGK
jgi:pimeloyl-ACP methyl ester carboxylesterase